MRCSCAKARQVKERLVPKAAWVWSAPTLNHLIIIVASSRWLQKRSLEVAHGRISEICWCWETHAATSASKKIYIPEITARKTWPWKILRIVWIAGCSLCANRSSQFQTANSCSPTFAMCLSQVRDINSSSFLSYGYICNTNLQFVSTLRKSVDGRFTRGGWRGCQVQFRGRRCKFDQQNVKDCK